jgi:hypothetical protein
LQQEKAQQTPSGKMGKEEPSSHAETAKPQDSAALINGALAVPGAATDTDTIPAKFSEKNAADDRLITVAYTFKLLNPEQRSAIYQALKGQPGGTAFKADIGTELPLAIELRAVPDEMIVLRIIRCSWYRHRPASWWAYFRIPIDLRKAPT